MKTLLMSLVTCASAVAMACPTFNGTYECSGGGLEQVLTVKTEMVGSVYKYSIDESVVQADGVSRPVDFQGGVYDMTASCQKETLNVDIVLASGQGDNPDCGNDTWNLVYALSFTPNGAQINEAHAGKTVCGSGKVVVDPDMAGTMTCVKK